MTRSVLDSHGRSRRSLLAASASLAALPGLAFGQDKYPSRPVEFVVPWGPGGGAEPRQGSWKSARRAALPPTLYSESWSFSSVAFHSSMCSR